MNIIKRCWIWIIMISSVIFSVRYLTWRSLHTLNPDMLWFSLILLTAEIHGFIATALYFFMVWHPTKRRSLPPLQNKTVDILIPTYNEPVYLLRMTLLGCKDLKYPHRTYVLDDGDRSDIKKISEDLGCFYISRKERKNAKAGNLNNALKHINGEFIVILDADQIPLPSLINETIGFFANEETALVQMPQDFYNLDSFLHSTNWKKGRSWHEQELFNDVIQPGKDHWNAAVYCDSVTIIRRKALDNIGGFAEGTITEDIHTSLKLHAGGWHSVYYNKTLARGIAPRTLNGFAIQRSRRGKGAMQVWRINNPLTMKGLSIPQRLCYFASMYTYFDGFQKLIYLITPIIILYTGFTPILTIPSVFINYFLPYFLISIYGSKLTMGSFKRLIMVEKFNMIKLVNRVKAVFIGFFGKETYAVTLKNNICGIKMNEVFLQSFLALLSGTAIIHGLFNISDTNSIQFLVYTVSIVLASYNILLIVPFAINAVGKKECRKLYRFDGKFDVAVKYENAKPTYEISEGSGFARNISSRGFSLTTDDPLFPSNQTLKLQIQLPSEDCIDALGELKTLRPLIAPGNKIKYIQGIEFSNMKQSDSDKITKFLMNVAAPKQAEIFYVKQEIQE